VNGATSSGFTFTAPDLTAALHDADNAAVSAGNKPISQTVVEIVAHDGQGSILSEPADYVISAPVVGSVTPSEIAVGGGQSVVSRARTLTERLRWTSNRSAARRLFRHRPRWPVTNSTSGPRPSKVFRVLHRGADDIDMYVRVDVSQSFGSVIYSNSTPFVVTI